MKCTIPEISWHNRDPILSVDIQQNSNDRFIRLATAGADFHVLIWQVLVNECSKTNLEAISDLTRHQRPVNIVRWSPSGQYLASGDDDANIIIWQLKTDNIPSLDGETNDKETWIVFKILRGHKEDVYDLCWSPDNLKLVSGSIDNTAIIWNLGKGKNEHIFSESKGFVQGVSWDPKNQFIASLSSDRVCRVMDCITKQIKSKSFRGHLPVPESHSLYEKDVKYFHDDTFKSFFRRLSFSPDGNLLVTPSGCIESEDCQRCLNATYLYTMDSLSKPAAILPLTKQSSIAVRFCPIFFELQSDGPQPFVDLPYRMIFAVATDNDVILYDTQQMAPFAILQRIHYTRLTDLTWSADGRLLIASSTDGFCTIVSFDERELGVMYVLEDSEPEESPLDVTENERKDRIVEEEPVAVVNVKRKRVEDVRPKKPNLLENWAIKGNDGDCINVLQVKRKKVEEKMSPEDVKSEKINVIQSKKEKIEEVIVIEDSSDQIIEDNGKDVTVKSKGINILQPRRKKTEEKSSSAKLNEANTQKSSITLLESYCKRVERKSEKINLLQPRKKTEEATVVKDLDERTCAESAETFENDKRENEGVKSKTINILQPRRKNIVEEETSSETRTIQKTSEEKGTTKSEKKSNKINVLQPRRKQTSIVETSKEVKEINAEESENSKCKIPGEKSQLKGKKTEQKPAPDKSKVNVNKEENAENSKPRKSNILEQWTIKKTTNQKKDSNT